MGGEFDLDITLTVTQLPVRGVVKTASDTKTIHLPTPEFRRGAVNDDAEIDISDPFSLLLYLFQTAPEPSCLEAADATDDGIVNLADALYVLNYLFLGGPALPLPFVDCGLDPTPDTLGCAFADCS
jgi:hypothetical protein